MSDLNFNIKYISVMLRYNNVNVSDGGAMIVRVLQGYHTIVSF